MWEKVKKVLKWLAAPVLFLAGLVVGRNFFGRNADEGSGGKVDADIARTADLVSQAERELADLRATVEDVGRETAVSTDKLRGVKSGVERCGEKLGELKLALDGYAGTAGQIADYARRYDELSSESAAIMEELLRRAGETDFFAEEGEHVSLDNDCVDSIFGADGHSDELDREV